MLNIYGHWWMNACTYTIFGYKLPFERVTVCQNSRNSLTGSRKYKFYFQTVRIISFTIRVKKILPNSEPVWAPRQPDQRDHITYQDYRGYFLRKVYGRFLLNLLSHVLLPPIVFQDALSFAIYRNLDDCQSFHGWY